MNKLYKNLDKDLKQPLTEPYKSMKLTTIKIDPKAFFYFGKCPYLKSCKLTQHNGYQDEKCKKESESE